MSLEIIEITGIDDDKDLIHILLVNHFMKEKKGHRLDPTTTHQNNKSHSQLAPTSSEFVRTSPTLTAITQPQSTFPPLVRAAMSQAVWHTSKHAFTHAL